LWSDEGVSDELLFCQARDGGKRLRHGGRRFGEGSGKWQHVRELRLGVWSDALVVRMSRGV